MLQLQHPTPAPSREDRIREEFAHLGTGMTTAEFARHCIAVGIYATEELEQFLLKGIQADIRRALKRPDESGLPFAGMTVERDEDGAPVWKPRQLWLFEDYEINIADHLRQRDAEHWAAVALSDEAFARFGRRIVIPSIGGTAAAAD